MWNERTRDEIEPANEPANDGDVDAVASLEEPAASEPANDPDIIDEPQPIFVTPDSRVRRVLVEFSLRGDDWGYCRGAGALVHLDESVGGGLSLDDALSGGHLKPEWLESVE
jgi:hypothetical protein